MVPFIYNHLETAHYYFLEGRSAEPCESIESFQNDKSACRSLMCICLHIFDICVYIHVYTHTPMVQQKSGTEAFAYSSYVALLFLLYNKNGYLEGWNVLVISQSWKIHAQLCLNMDFWIPWSMILLVGVRQCVSKHEVVCLFPPFQPIPTFVALSAVQRWESNTGSIPWNRLRYFTCAMVTRCVRTTATCKHCLGTTTVLNGPSHTVSYQVLSY